MIIRILSFLCLAISFSLGQTYDCLHFVKDAIKKDPLVAEKRFSTNIKREQLATLKAEVILPTFNFSMMVGPAPGLKEHVDSWGDTVEAWDFSKIGPYWGTQIKVTQPLNLGQYNVGKKSNSSRYSAARIGATSGRT